jgi:hypothetical protein
MNHLPATNPPEAESAEPSRIVDAEIVGLEPPRPPLWRRLAAKAALGLVLGAVGLCAVVLGAILTVTIIGAAVGIPMVVVGLILCLMALFAPFMLGRARFHILR